MGLFNHHHDTPRIEYNGHQYTLAAFVAKFNEVRAQLDQVQGQLADLRKQVTAHHDTNQRLQEAKDRLAEQVAQLKEQLHGIQDAAGTSVVEIDVAGTRMKAPVLADRYLESNRALAAANDQLDQANQKLAAQEEDNRRLAAQLAAAQRVEIDGQSMTIPELVQRYQQLARQLAELREQTADQQPLSTARPATPPSDQELIDRYYDLVQEVLAEYQKKVAQLRKELTGCLNDHHESEFLQLVDLRTSPTNYQRLLRERSQQLLAYIEDHPHQEKMLRHDDRAADESVPVRGLNYWHGLVDEYRQMVAGLLEKNADVRNNYRFALHYDKERAKQIAGKLPFYLSTQNVVDLRTILGGINNEETVDKDVAAFQSNIAMSQKGADGEQLVRDRLQDYEHGRVMFALNLPYQYEDGRENSNQVDGIVVNKKGIFILEIKNYTGAKIWINRDGYAVTEKANGQPRVHKGYRDRSIVDQGEDHYSAVLKAMKSDDDVARNILYLSKHLHVLYVSTNPHAKIVTTGADVDPDHRFISLDKLQETIDDASGNLFPNIIQSVAAAISNQQKGEKQFKYKCFPTDPGRRADQAWQQYKIMQKMLRLKLDDLVDQRDPWILEELDTAGLRASNGYVTSKPHQHKK